MPCSASALTSSGVSSGQAAASPASARRTGATIRAGMFGVSTMKRTYYNQRLFLRRAIALSLCVVAGAAAALVLMPRIVRVSPDDTARLCTILDALHAPRTPPLVVFGDSTGLFGVDAQLLGGWNLCSPAQTIGEGFLLQQELPASVNVVVHLVSPSMIDRKDAVDRDHYNAMRLCGYAPRADTREAIARVFRFELDVRPLSDRLEGRRHVRAAIEGFARDVMRGNRRGGWLPEQRFADLAGTRFAMNASQVQMLRECASHARRHYVVVLAPIHPRLQASAACPSGLDCVDLTRLLNEQEFLDPMHANRDGARKLTAAIRDALTARRLLLKD